MSHVGILTWVGTPAVPSQMESWRHHETSLTDGTTGPRIHIYTDEDDLLVTGDGSFCAFSGELYDVDSDRPLVGTEAAARVLESMSQLASFSEIDAAGAATVGRAGVDQLFVARDPVGAGSLFFAKTPQHLIWASRLRDLVALLPSVSERQEAVDTYLAIGMVPSPWTFYREIRRLGAGEAIIVERGEWRVERYHDFTTGSPRGRLRLRRTRRGVSWCGEAPAGGRAHGSPRIGRCRFHPPSRYRRPGTRSWPARLHV